MRKEYDFSKAKRGAVVRAPKGKTRITIRIDHDLLAWFKQQVNAACGGNYQSLINAVLREHMKRKVEPLEATLRRILREDFELQAKDAVAGPDLKEPMATGKNTVPAASVPFRAADHLHNDKDIAGYIEAMLDDGDPRAIPVALRSVADALGGMAALANKTRLSRETLYRALREKGNTRLKTLGAFLTAFGLRLSVKPIRRAAARRGEIRPVHARDNSASGRASSGD